MAVDNGGRDAYLLLNSPNRREAGVVLESQISMSPSGQQGDSLSVHRRRDLASAAVLEVLP